MDRSHDDGPRGRRRSRVLGAIGWMTGLAILASGSYVAMAWYRYGRTARKPTDSATDHLLASFMPHYEVAECHETDVAAPAAVTYAAARAMDIHQSPLVRAIFALRTLPARRRWTAPPQPSRSLVEETLALGWRILAEVPDRALVMGAVTQPWHTAPVFRGLAPEEFARFTEPGYVKILWTLEVEPLDGVRSHFRTRTRVCTTDAGARTRFRRYWALVSAGVLMIRRSSLGLVKTEAERRFRVATAAPAQPAVDMLH